MKAVSAAIIALAGAVLFQKEPAFGIPVGLIGLIAWIFAFAASSGPKEH